MFFRQLLHEEQSCLSYVVGCQSKSACAVIDPQGDPKRYIELAERHGMKVSAVIDTHIHADHVSSARELANASGATLSYGPEAKVTFPHRTLNDGDVFMVGNRQFRVFHTPGHTSEHITLLVNDWFLLTGDTLFVSDVGRVDLTTDESAPGADASTMIEANARQLHASLKRLFEFPDWTELYPAHFGGSVCGRGIGGKPVSTIGRERFKNKPTRLSLEEFIKFQLESHLAPPQDFTIIKRRNEGR